MRFIIVFIYVNLIGRINVILKKNSIGFLHGNETSRRKNNGNMPMPMEICLCLFKSGNPEISPGGVQNEKIENSQTLSGHRSR